MRVHRQRSRLHEKVNYVNRWVKYSLCFANFTFSVAGATFVILSTVAFVESGGIPNHSTINLLQWVFNLTIICIGIGVIAVFVSMAGFLGSLRENRFLLRFYYTTLTVLFLGEVVCCVLFFVYRETAIKKVEDLIRSTFVTQYREMGFDDTTNFMDFIQKELQCCGPKSYTDWTANRYFSCNKTNKSPEACGVPFSCCRRMNDITANVINTSCGFGVQQHSAPFAVRHVWTTGCVQALVTLIESNVVPVSCAVGGIAVLQLLAILLAKTLHTQIGDQLRLLQQESGGF